MKLKICMFVHARCCGDMQKRVIELAEKDILYFGPWLMDRFNQAISIRTKYQTNQFLSHTLTRSLAPHFIIEIF